MRTPPIDRRSFLRSAGAAWLATIAPRSAEAIERADAVYATAICHRDGYGICLLTERGEIATTTPLPDRGHDIVRDPALGRLVVFARQPGTFAVVVDPAGRAAPVTIASAEGRHFFGHGAFSPDGGLLYATENEYDAAAGMVGIYDTRDGWRRIGEFPTHGVGPHELLLLGDGRTLAIANGGIETHPDFGRAKLNLATMRPSLVLIDRLTGALVERHVLPADLHQLSIRHLDEDGSGRIWFGCQHEGAATETPPLAGYCVPGHGLTLVDMPADALRGLRNYVGSVAANRTAGTVALTSPQGDSLVVLDAASGSVVRTLSQREVCGVSADGEGFITTAGDGAIVAPSGRTARHDGIVFDNHLLRL